MDTKTLSSSKKELSGGVLVALIGLIGALLVGQVSGYEAQQLLSSSLTNINMLCNTIILASATILALLFTLLGLSSGTDFKFNSAFYGRIKQIALFDAVLFVITMVVFLILNLPIDKSGEFPTSWFSVIYYITITASSIVGGLIVTVILLLYHTISDLIKIVGFGQKKEHPMVDMEEDQPKEKD